MISSLLSVQMMGILFISNQTQAFEVFLVSKDSSSFHWAPLPNELWLASMQHFISGIHPAV